MKPRLNPRVFKNPPGQVSLPAYDREQTRAGIVHLGVGAFHRAHQAWYTEQVLNRQGGDWAILGASLRSPNVRDQMNPQDGLYTVVVRDGESERYQLVGAIKEVLVAREDPEALVAQLSAPDIRVVTLTITEKGYFYNAATKGLVSTAPEIQQDLAAFPHRQTTAIGLLAASVLRRRDSGAGGVTLLSCDNLSHNGKVLATVLRDFVSQAAPDLLEWIDFNVTFPCSMVDRIVPATTEESLGQLEKAVGYRDEAAVFTEPFSQWVIENNFARGAPDWQGAGALYTDDVAPFETMKLRLLNGSHSLMAYLGYLAGHDYVHQVMAVPVFNRLVREFMDNQAEPTLNIPTGFDIAEYKDNLCQRFANSALNHRTYQIAQDGSQKIPQRWLAPLAQLLAQGADVSIIALAIAGWCRYLGGEREDGQSYMVDDPLYGAVLKPALAAGGGPRELLATSGIFGSLATSNPQFVEQVNDFYRQLADCGVEATIGSLISSRV